MLDLLMIAAEAAHGAEEHVYPTAFGIAPHGWTAIAMLVVFAIMLWAGVPKIVAGILDDRINTIRKQLDEAAKLREEAAALKADYEKRTQAADGEIAELKAAAEKQAGDIVAKAMVDAANLVERRKQLAEEKIAAAERNAIEELREKAAVAATAAARSLIAEKHGEGDDRKLVDETISNI